MCPPRIKPPAAAPPPSKQATAENLQIGPTAKQEQQRGRSQVVTSGNNTALRIGGNGAGLRI